MHGLAFLGVKRTTSHHIQTLEKFAHGQLAITLLPIPLQTPTCMFKYLEDQCSIGNASPVI
jgi:hypothetical protein